MEKWIQADESFPGAGPAVTAPSAVKALAGAAVLTLAMAALICRVGYLQFAEPARYTRLAAAASRAEPQLTRRGDVYDRRGRLLATSVPLWSVFADPQEINSPLDTARILARVLDADRELVHARLSQSDRRFVWIKRHVSESRAEWVRALGLSGIHLRREYRRFYPFGDLCAHVVGFTDTDGRGLEGVEAFFNDVLAGRQSGFDSGFDATGRGFDVYLTIDAYIQSVTQKALMRQVELHAPEAAWALVLDLRSGEVLSMVNWPSYDPASPASVPAADRRNRIITDVYEYGSVMKPVTVAIALEEGIVQPDTEFDCHRGAWRFGRRTIHDVRGHGLLTVSDIVTHSSNIGVAQIGLQLERERFWSGLRSFGFGAASGIELAGESVGIMRPPARWNEHSLISIAFGQELSINAMALARAYTALAGGGQLVRPTIVHRVVEPVSGRDLYKLHAHRREFDRAVSPDTARQVADMMERVVREGTGSRAAVEHYTAGGKTGTGSLMCLEGRGYSRSRYISTFVGFAPAENPRIVVLVSLKVPTRGGYYGGAVAGPAFSEIAGRSLGYLNVPSDIQKDFFAGIDTVDFDKYYYY